MKKILILLLICGLTTCMITGPALGTGYGMAIVDGRSADRVHLREGPSTNAKSLGLYFTGTEALCQSAPGEEWVMVTIGSESGYMKGEFLAFGAGAGGVIAKQPTGIVKNPGDAQWIDFRYAPTPHAPVAGTFSNGDAVTILGETDTHWYYVNAGGSYGYVPTNHVLLTDHAAMSLPAPRLINAYTSIEYYPVNRQYPTKAGNYLELDLVLPRLSGNEAGILAINQFFAGKEQFFYSELPFDVAEDAAANGRSIRGMQSGYYRSAYYSLTAAMGSIVSFSAVLDGGAGGVCWCGIEGNTFDLKTGERLGLSDIFNANQETYMGVIHGFVTGRIADDISAAVKSGIGSPYFFDDAYSGQGYASIRAWNPEDFYLTQDALVVFYQKYALAAGAAGPLEFEISYAAISDMLMGM